MNKGPIHREKRTRKRVVLYGTAECPKCKALKRFLQARRIPVRWKDVAEYEGAMQELASLTGGRAPIPVLMSGKLILIAWDRRKWTAITEKLQG